MGKGLDLHLATISAYQLISFDFIIDGFDHLKVEFAGQDYAVTVRSIEFDGLVI